MSVARIWPLRSMMSGRLAASAAFGIDAGDAVRRPGIMPNMTQAADDAATKASRKTTAATRMRVRISSRGFAARRARRAVSECGAIGAHFGPTRWSSADVPVRQRAQGNFVDGGDLRRREGRELEVVGVLARRPPAGGAGWVSTLPSALSIGDAVALLGDLGLEPGDAVGGDLGLVLQVVGDAGADEHDERGTGR